MRASFLPVCPLCWAITGAAACKSSPAAVKSENIFLRRCMFIFLQNLKRASNVTRRMPPVPVTSPNVNEFTTVLMDVKCTVLKTLFAEARSSSARDSLIWIVLLSDMLSETCPGPSMIFRTASPKREPFGLAQAALGEQNAAVLNHLSAVGSLTEMDCPAMTFARSDPLTPRLMSSPPPSTRGVKYSPDPTMKSPLHCHPPRMWLNAPLVTNRRLSPNGRSRIQFPVNLCRWSKLESPRSAEIRNGSCATTLPPPPIDDASSMDFENTYCALSPSPFVIRLRTRIEAACNIEFPSEDSWINGWPPETTRARSVSSRVPFAPV